MIIAERIKPDWLIGIIILFHAVGVAGFMLPQTQQLFLQVVPFHLLLMLIVLTLSHNSFDKRFVSFAFIIFFSGFIAECIGVNTGLLFGNYQYGHTLAFKLFNVPLMIGVNWLLLIYSAGVTMRRIGISNTWLRIAIGAWVLVLLDVLIEPVAIRFDYWSWQSAAIPMKNYLCWYLLSFLLLYVFEKFNFKKQSMVGTVLLVVQFIFFIILRVVQ